MHVFFYLFGNNVGVLLNSVIQIIMTKGDVDTIHNWRNRKDLENSERSLHAFPNRWIKQCASFNRTSGVYQVVVDGVFITKETLSEDKVGNMPTDFSGKLFVGNSLELPLTKTKVTNLNIYSSAHSVEVMRSNTKEKTCIEDGDYLAWKDMKWTLYGGVSIQTVDAEEPCVGEPDVVIFPASMNQVSCMQLCENMGSRAPSLQTVKDWLVVKKFVQMFKIWSSVDDKVEEDKWLDFSTQQVMNQSEAWLPWAPDGGYKENCATIVNMGLSGLNDDNCDLKVSCMCDSRPETYLRLRGLCKDSVIDTHYQPKSNQSDFKDLGFKTAIEPEEIKGFMLLGLHTTIEHDWNSGFWNLLEAKTNATGVSKLTKASFTLGRHNWTITGDKGCNENLQSASYTIELKMTGCNYGDFTCNDGQCVSMEHRCDQLPHCRDTSDEMGCEIMVLKAGYNKNIPPISSRNGLKIAVDVNVSLDIFKLVAIKEEDYSIEIQFQITMVWKENRVKYQNLKVNDSLNALTEDDIQRLWLPRVIFENTDQKDTTRLGTAWEWDTSIDVKREGHFNLSGLETVDETYIFPGDEISFDQSTLKYFSLPGVENSLIMNQTYTREFQCWYEFTWYPFDTQVGFVAKLDNWCTTSWVEWGHFGGNHINLFAKL